MKNTKQKNSIQNLEKRKVITIERDYIFLDYTDYDNEKIVWLIFKLRKNYMPKTVIYLNLDLEELKELISRILSTTNKIPSATCYSTRDLINTFISTKSWELVEFNNQEELLSLKSKKFIVIYDYNGTLYEVERLSKKLLDKNNLPVKELYEPEGNNFLRIAYVNEKYSSLHGYAFYAIDR